MLSLQMHCVTSGVVAAKGCPNERQGPYAISWWHSHLGGPRRNEPLWHSRFGDAKLLAEAGPAWYTDICARTHTLSISLSYSSFHRGPNST